MGGGRRMGGRGWSGSYKVDAKDGLQKRKKVSIRVSSFLLLAWKLARILFLESKTVEQLL